jgi:hypothetical protein
MIEAKYSEHPNANKLKDYRTEFSLHTLFVIKY